MSAQKIETHTFENGLTLLVEQMPGVKSGAFSLMVPGGSVFDPPDANGSAALLCEMLIRGAGDLGSREFNAALDNLGVQHREHAGNQFVTFSVTSSVTSSAAFIVIFWYDTVCVFCDSGPNPSMTIGSRWIQSWRRLL